MRAAEMAGMKFIEANTKKALITPLPTETPYTEKST